jgi:hypothetical protein
MPPQRGAHAPRHLTVSDGVVRVEGGEEHRSLDAGLRRATEVFFQWRGCVPGAGQSVALAGVAVGVDDLYLCHDGSLT